MASLVRYGVPHAAVSATPPTRLVRPPVVAAAAPVAETTLDAAGGSFWSNYNPHTTVSLTVPAGALAVVISANASLDASNAFTVTNSGTARTWTRLNSYTPASDHLVVDYWYNGTGSSVTMTVTITYVNGDGFNDDVLSWVGAISGVADPATTPPQIVATVSNGSTAQASATPSQLGSLLCLHYFQANASADISSLVAGSASDTSPLGHFFFSGESRAIGTIYQTATNAQTASPVTVGATAPTSAQTFAFLVEYFPASTGGTNATATPTVVSSSTAVPTPTVSTGETVTATVVACSTSIPTPAVHTGETVTAAVVACSTTVPTPSVSAGGSATVNAAVVACTTTIPTPTLSTGETVTATVVVCSTAIPTPAVSAGGSATATPSVVSCTTSISTPVVSRNGKAGVAPGVVACTTATQSPTDFMIVVADMQPGAGANPPPTVVAAKVVADAPSYVLMPGDLANDGTTAQYGFFNTMYGSIKSNIYPVPGNHDWVPGNLTSYNTYWGSQGGTGNTPPNCYSFDTTTGWHVIGIDSDQANVGSLNNPSSTYTFVVNDLAANTGKPIIAFWHHPRWSEGTNSADPGGTADSTVTQDIWDALVDAQADLVFVGHCHSYQRFPKFGKTGSGSSQGIREFVVGTGGSGLFTLKATGRRTEFDSYQSTAYDQLNSQYFGYLRVWLTATAYRWQFISQNQGIIDQGGWVTTNLSNLPPTPAVIIGSATVYSPVISHNGINGVGAAAVACSTAIPTPTVSTGSTVTAAVVACTTTIATPVITSSVAITAAVVACTATIPTPVVSTGATAAAAVVACTTSVPTPSVSAGGSVTINAAVVACSMAIPTPAVSAGNSATVAASVVACAISIPAPVVRQDVTVAAVKISAVTTVGAATVTSSATVQATVLACSITIPGAVLHTGSTAIPAVINVPVTIPLPIRIPPPLLLSNTQVQADGGPSATALAVGGPLGPALTATNQLTGGVS